MLLLYRMTVFFIALAFPGNSKALPHRHIRLRLGHQRIPDILLGSAGPGHVVLVAERPDGHVAVAAHKLAGRVCRLGCDGVNVHFELFAIGF